MGKVWVLDTETKGTGAEMVPLEKAQRRSAGRGPTIAPKPSLGLRRRPLREGR